MRKKHGFTLIEILITTLLVFLLFTVMYGTFFSVSNTIERIESRMKTSEIIFRFLNRFSREIKCMMQEEKDTVFFDNKEISFITIVETFSYPMEVTYTVKKTQNGFEELFRKQKNLLTNYSFSFPVIDGCDSINFLFYIDGVWHEYVDETGKVSAIGLEMKREKENLFFPVKIYGSNIDEKKE